MLDYKNGKVYKIVCNATDKIYIGSTAEKRLSNRIGGHRTDLKAHAAGKPNAKYCTSFEVMKPGNYTYEEIEYYECDCKQDLQDREGYYVREFKKQVGELCVNKCIPRRTKKEWRADNKERISANNKKWNEDNKGHKSAYNKKWKEANKERISANNKKWYEDNKGHKSAYNKKWRADNKERISANNKKWYEDNKDHKSAYNKKWRADNKERIAANNKKWKAANKERIAANNKKRRAANNQTKREEEILAMSSVETAEV